MKLGIYKHSKKGTLYRVIGVAMHSETFEVMVVYETLYDNPKSKLWVRPASMFEELIEIGGTKLPRFQYVGE